MSTNLRIERSSRSLLAILFVGGLVACTTQEAKTDAGTGKGGGAGTTTGTGGTAGSGAVDSGLATSDGVLCPLPATALITNFSLPVPDGGADPDAGAVATDYVHFGDATTLGGSEFVYPTATQNPTYPVTSNVSANNWHITGSLGDYSGFGLYFDNCTRVDAMAYRGVSFTISGTVAAPGAGANTVTMGMGTLNNVIAASWQNAHPAAGMTALDPAAPGRCIPTTGTDKYSQTSCADATKVVPITTTPTTVTILWTDFVGGKPKANIEPGDITSFYWFFPPPTGAGSTTPTPYMADIVIDDLSFVP